MPFDVLISSHPILVEIEQCAIVAAIHPACNAFKEKAGSHSDELTTDVLTRTSNVEPFQVQLFKRKWKNALYCRSGNDSSLKFTRNKIREVRSRNIPSKVFERDLAEVRALIL